MEQQSHAKTTEATCRTSKRLARPKPTSCLNCGTAATGKFCAECGQENKFHNASLKPLLADLLADAISWDSRLLRTLSALIKHPGFLTNQYNAGRLAPYLTPLKLYLTISVLFFLLLAWKDPLKNAVVISPGGLHVTSTSGTIHERTTKNTNVQMEGAVASRLLKAAQNKTGFAQALLNDIPKMMFLMLPIFAVWLKLLYLRTRRLYVEHVVFLLHVHALGFLALSPLLLYHPVWLTGFVTLALLVYVLFAMRAVYRQSWIKTLLKFSLLSFGYLLLFSLSFVGTTLVALWLL